VPASQDREDRLLEFFRRDSVGWNPCLRTRPNRATVTSGPEKIAAPPNRPFANQPGCDVEDARLDA